jgi:hypothetical protein
VNPLTKACVALAADHDHNRVADVDQWQGSPPDLFSQLAYFVELHEGWYQPPLPGELRGRYVIRERSRCDPAFPLKYQDADGAWWRECTVRRDPSYGQVSAAPPQPGVNLDFGAWSCSDATGACAPLPPPAPPPAGPVVPDHGLCSTALPPADGTWRGMNHASQFKCVVIAAALPAADAAKQRTRTLSQLVPTLGAGVTSTLRDQFNACRATAGRTEAPELPMANPRSPVVTCEAVGAGSVRNDDVGWVAVRPRFKANGTVDDTYAGGCVAEWTETGFRRLCPGYVANPASVNGDSDPANFGKLVCGCNSSFGGSRCDVPCADADLLLSPGFNPLSRQGLWMCARASASEGTVLGGPADFSIAAEAWTGPVGALCESAGCGSGWVLQ